MLRGEAGGLGRREPLLHRKLVLHARTPTPDPESPRSLLQRPPDPTRPDRTRLEVQGCRVSPAAGAR